MTGVSILICTYNRRDILWRTLEGMTKLNLPVGIPIELVLVCNACTDGSEALGHEWVAKMPFPMRVVNEPEPGLSVARNRAVREARYDILAFTDDDVLVDPDWVNGLLEVYREHGERVGVVGGRIELWWEAVQRPDWLPTEVEWLLASLDSHKDVTELEKADLLGANFSCRRAVFDQAGPFRKELGRTGNNFGGFEEAVFIEGAFKHGWRVFYTPRASVKHWVQPKRVASLEWFHRLPLNYGAQWVLLRETADMKQWARWIVGAGYRLVYHGAAELVLRPFGCSRPLVYHMVGRATGQGMARGLWLRARGRSAAG